jgi:hypothetical protein
LDLVTISSIREKEKKKRERLEYNYPIIAEEPS